MTAARSEGAVPLLRKADQVYEQLRLEFVRGEWPFGKAFSTYDLAERFGISRRPVMDAVAKLESEGFVEVIPQVGCRVIAPTARQVREHFEVAAALEGAAARLAAIAGEAAAIARLEAIHERAEPVVGAGDSTAFAALNRELHVAILEASGNATITALARGAWDLRDFYLQHKRHRRSAETLEQRHAEHRGVIDAIRAGDAVLARTRMEEHVERFMRDEVIPRWEA